jgi:aminopeptidase N
LPFVIPVAYGLMAADGRELATGMHVLTSATETLTFDQIESAPVPSLLRGFSAPVVLDTDYSDDQLLTCWPTTPTRSTAGKPGSGWHFGALLNS